MEKKIQENIKKILENENLTQNQILKITTQVIETVQKEIKKHKEKITVLKSKVANLESELDSKFKPNKSIILKIPNARRPNNKIPDIIQPTQIPQTRRPESETDDFFLKPDFEDDQISIISFRPDEGLDEEDVREIVLDKKMEAVDRVIEKVSKENQEIQEQIQMRLAYANRTQFPVDFALLVVINFSLLLII